MDALSHLLTDNILKKYKITITKKKELYRNGFRALKIDLLSGSTDIFDLLKREEVATLALSEEFREVQNSLIPTLREKCHQLFPARSVSQSILDKVKIYRNLFPLSGEDKFIVVDRATNKLVAGSAQQWLERESLNNKDLVKDIERTADLCQLIYDPTKPTGIVEDMGEGIYRVFNTFYEQAWKSLEPNGVPEEFARFSAHLFPDEQQRANVFAWSYDALFNRSELALVLLGTQGCGKTTYAYTLMNLVGMDACTEMTPRIFNGNGDFNGELACKKIAFGDEIVCRGDEQKNKLKRNMNERIQIEAKNKQPYYADNYISFIFACNHPRLLEVEPLDRRFLIYDLAKTRADDSLIRIYKSKYKDPQYQSNIVNFLKQNMNTSFDLHSPDKNTTSFWAMVKHGAPPHFKHTFRYLEKHEGEWVTYQQLNDTWESVKAARNLFPSFDELCDYLKSYRPMGISTIGIDYDSYSFRFNSFGNQKEDLAEWDSL